MANLSRLPVVRQEVWEWQYRGACVGMNSAVFFSPDAERGASKLDVEMTEDGAREIAVRARGTPRVAGRLLRRVRDVATVEGALPITQAVADRALRRLDVDELGLEALDRRYLRTIAEHFGGGPVGVETIAASLAEARDAVEDVIEPFLLQQGLIQRTPRGRMLTDGAYRHLGLAAPAAPGQADLF